MLLNYEGRGFYISRKYYKIHQLDMINNDNTMTQYKPEDLVYLISPQASLLKSSSRAFRFIYIGPLVEY